MTEEEFKSMRRNVILYAIAVAILALDLYVWRP